MKLQRAVLPAQSDLSALPLDRRRLGGENGTRDALLVTRIHVTAAFDDVLVVGVVELNEGPQLLALIDELYAALEIGDQIGIEPIEYDTGYDQGWLEEHPFFEASLLGERSTVSLDLKANHGDRRGGRTG